MKKLLVGYDGSDVARRAADVAAQAAKRLNGSVTVLTVGFMTHVRSLPKGAEDAWRQTATEGAEIVRTLGVDADARVEPGEPGATIAKVATREGYDLVIVGYRGRGGIQEMFLGSTAKALAEKAPCPVLVVRGTTFATLQRILVAVDGSKHALRAAEAAMWLARAFGAHITVLYVLDSAALAAVPHPAAWLELRVTLLKLALETLATARERCEQMGVTCDAVQVEGRPADVISHWARDGGYDLVALGRRGLGGIERLVLGSVSDAVLRASTSLVLLAGEQEEIKPS